LEQIDTIPSVMNAAGDKMVTNGKGDSNTRSRKGGKAGPAATVKFGSASVPIYLSESKGRKRYFIAHYRDGKRIRKAFPDLTAAKKEALFVAQRIQSGMQHVTDLKPHERDSYAKAVELLGELNLPMVAAVEDYVQARKLMANSSGTSAVGKPGSDVPTATSCWILNCLSASGGLRRSRSERMCFNPSGRVSAIKTRQ
jgi:hypothetical protein